MTKVTDMDGDSPLTKLPPIIALALASLGSAAYALLNESDEELDYLLGAGVASSLVALLIAAAAAIGRRRAEAADGLDEQDLCRIKIRSKEFAYIVTRLENEKVARDPKRMEMLRRMADDTADDIRRLNEAGECERAAQLAVDLRRAKDALKDFT